MLERSLLHIASVADPSFHTLTHCNDLDCTARICFQFQLLSILLYLGEDSLNQEAPRMLFSESLGRYAFVHRDRNPHCLLNLLFLQMGKSSLDDHSVSINFFSVR